MVRKTEYSQISIENNNTNLWCICSYFGRLAVVALRKQVVEFTHKEFLCAGEIVADSDAQRQVWVL